MPTAEDNIRNQFMKFDDEGQCIDDGIAEAESIIVAEGATITIGIIRIGKGKECTSKFYDAVNYLVHEWDYAFEPI